MTFKKASLWIPFCIALAVLTLGRHLFGQFAYVANEFSISVSGYAINPTTGELTPVPGSPFVAGNELTSVAVDPTGKFAYVPDDAHGNILVYSISPTTGVLTPVPGSPFPARYGAYCVVVDPTDRFAYVTNYGSKRVSGYTINPTTGALTPILGSPYPAGSYPQSLAVDPTGRFVYVGNSGGTGARGDVSGYTIDATTGALTPMPGSPFAAGTDSWSVAVDPTGKFAYVANYGSSDVSGYTIDTTTGALIPMPGSPFRAGGAPRSMAVDPTGRFAYTANADSGVSGFTVNPNTGALTPIPGSPFTAGEIPQAVAVDPTGRFAYVGNLISNDVWGYEINPTTGALTPIPGSPFAAGNGPIWITTTPLLTIQLSAANLDFGNQTPGTTSPSQKVIMTNSTPKPVTITSIAANGDFAETNDCSSSLAVGAFCTISVTFTPTETGARTGILTISDSAPRSPHTVLLGGTGTLPAGVSLTPPSLTFASQFIGTVSAQQKVTLQSTGGDTLNITRIVTTGDFAQTNNCGASVVAGASCTFNITFKPILKWRRTGGLYLYDNAAGSPQKVALDGQGTVVTLTPASLNFGNQTIGTTSASQTLTLTNTSSTPLNLWCTEIATGNNEDFFQTNTCGTGIRAGASCTIQVTFKPRYKGARSSQFRAHGDGGGTPWAATVTGNGTVLTLPARPAK